MRDANLQILSAFYNALSGVISPPVYKGYVSARISTSAYVVLSSVNVSDASTMHSNDTENSVRVSIYTKDTLANSSLERDVIADAILRIILSNPQASLTTTDFQVCGLKLTGDDSPDVFENGSSIFANRFLTFRVLVAHPVDA
jgi:hypothetical protein